MYEYKAYVDRVVDGDTADFIIDLGFHTFVTKRVRFIGVDAPERFTDKGKVTKSFVEQKLPVGSTVVIKTKIDSNDKYGRVLGEIFIDTYLESLNKMLINNGLASPYA